MNGFINKEGVGVDEKGYGIAALAQDKDDLKAFGSMDNLSKGDLDSLSAACGFSPPASPSGWQPPAPVSLESSARAQQPPATGVAQAQHFSGAGVGRGVGMGVGG